MHAWIYLCPWLYWTWKHIYIFRKELQTLYNLLERTCIDFCVHRWCSIYTIFQEYREFKNHGLEPSKSIKQLIFKFNDEACIPLILKKSFNLIQLIHF